MMFWYGPAGWAFWQIALMWVFMIAFWGLLIWAVYALITNLTRQSGGGPAGDGARRILDERLARGEIDTDEYRRLRAAMTQEGQHPPAVDIEPVVGQLAGPSWATTRISPTATRPGPLVIADSERMADCRPS